MPDDAPWIEPVVVPDDLSELQPDIDAYHRELRLAARKRRIARLTGSRAWGRLIVPLGVTSAALALAGIVFVVLTLGQPRPEPTPPPGPIATAPGAPVGQLHGLLPDTTVSTHSGSLAVRDLRPALLALVPLRCDCLDLLSRLAGQADEFRVPLVVVAPAAVDAEIDTLAGRLHRGVLMPVFDAEGELADTYGGPGVTALVVASDATVSYVQQDVPLDVRLEPYLQFLVTPVMSAGDQNRDA